MMPAAIVFFLVKWKVQSLMGLCVFFVFGWFYGVFDRIAEACFGFVGRASVFLFVWALYFFVVKFGEDNSAIKVRFVRWKGAIKKRGVGRGNQSSNK